MKLLKPWTNEDNAKLAAMIEAGASARRISLALRRNLAMIKVKAKAMGKPFPHERDLARERRKLVAQGHERW